MKKMMKAVATIDEYIALYPEEIQVLLKKMRQTIAKAAPKAEEAIRYGIPTYRLHNKNLVHFGAFKTHIGFFPTASGVKAFKKELAEYKCSKGTIQFPLDERLPLTLVTKITKFRVGERAK
ncbi:MAG TPA: DUF1801 domain-containing protein [Candidatus Paceibacterota bacterium]|nr:DUF1801 domain-containing protein [Candidatus Paceibacterota bacterium]